MTVRDVMIVKSINRRASHREDGFQGTAFDMGCDHEVVEAEQVTILGKFLKRGYVYKLFFLSRGFGAR
jgi:hypothetical protein